MSSRANRRAERAAAEADMTPEAERLQQFLRFSAPFGPIGTLLVAGFWWVWGVDVILILLVGCGVYWWLVFRGLRLVRENQLQSAVLCYAGGTLALSLGLGILVPAAYALTTMVAVLPVVIAVTYANAQTLLRVILLSTLIVGIGAVFTWIDPIYPMTPLVLEALSWVAHGTVVILVVQVGLSVWASHGKLGDAIDEMREANRKLRESERTLERKVAERTAELGEKNERLEDSQRELGLARDAALEASQAKSGFLANMSHELRTPLNAIIGYSEMLQEEVEEDGNASYVGDLERILTSGRYLLTLINGVLDLSKIEAGKMDVYLEDFDLEEVVRGIEGTVNPLLAQNANQLELRGVESVGRMRSDLTKVRQILFNLLSNATKFTREGTIALEVSKEAGGMLCFQVSDTGIGMSQEQLDKVFEAFAQADASTTREFGGTGLGLSISKRFCELLGGSIEAESEPGRGSRFVVRLPAQGPRPETTAQEQEARPAAPAEPGTAIVLVVDDDNAARDLIARFLRREGYRVVTAGGGEEALRLARERLPDIITLDIIMPQMDGWAVLAELKGDSALASVPVILLTMTDDRSLGYTLGASEFITKDIDWEKFAEVLQRYESADSARSALVVDDDRMARDMMRRALERAGWEVREAENGREALARLAEAPPRLILLDLMMPEMDGFEFVAALRAQEAWREIPVLVVTAKSLTGEDRSRLSGNVARILEKGSYTREDLLAEVSSLVGARTPPTTTT